MKRGLCRAALAIAFLSATGICSFAQESRFQAELRLEGEDIKDDCSAIKKVASCAATLVTDHPVHVTLGSIAPQNGFGFGPALVTHFTPGDQWRNTWSSDAVYATSGAWRAGTYFKAIHTNVELPTVVPSGTAARPIRITEYPVLSAYAQAISLPKLAFYGIGADSLESNKSTYGMSEVIVGGGGTLPLKVLPALKPAVFAEINGRMFDIRSGELSDTPQLAARFDESAAPGLNAAPAYVQFGEGVRVRPSAFDDALKLGYTFQLQQFVAPQSEFSFRRWSLDLNHEIRLYHTSAPALRRETNGPNECSVSPSTHACAPVTRDFWGTVGIRLFASKSQVGDEGAVPFYLQRTLGGSDIDGNRTLASYSDYRFRGPHVLLLQETFEHSLPRLPIGAFIQAEQGKAASQGEGLSFQSLRYTTTFGVTLRAGGFPVITASWSTGGREGNHFIVTMDTSLLGSGGRPSLQ
jgi:hypothetical protein